MADNISPQRNFSLDFLRGMALISMVIAHFFNEFGLPNDFFGSLLVFLAKGAPALFYFAFGITMHRFIEKEVIMQIRISYIFLFIALIHNLTFTGRLIYFDFFLFLWMAQVFTAVFVQTISNSRKTILLIVGITLAFMVLLPDGAASNLFKIALGNFPFFPWILFVLSGFVYAENIFSGESKSKKPIIALLLFIVPVLSHLAFKNSSLGILTLRKYPMTIPYFLFFLSINILLINISSKYEKAIKRVPIIPNLIVFFSKNLLLAAVLHYLPYLIIKIPSKVFLLNNFMTNEGNNLILFLISAVLSVFLLLVLIKGFLFLWNVIKDRNILIFLRRHNVLLFLVILAAYYIAVYTGTLINNGSLITESSLLWLTRIFHVLMIFIMGYFALVVGEVRSKNLIAAK